MHAFQVFTFKARRAAFLCGVCGFAWMAMPLAAVARDLVPEQPSVEVNIDALRSLETTPNTIAPPAPSPAPITYVPPAVVTPKPAPIVAPRPAPVPAVIATPRVEPSPLPTPTPAPSKPAPLPEERRIPAEQPVVAAPARTVVPAVTPVATPVANEAPPPKVKAPVAKPINPTTWQNAPLPTVVPSTQLPAVQATDTKPRTSDALQPRAGDVPPLPAAVLPARDKGRVDTTVPVVATPPKTGVNIPDAPVAEAPIVIDKVTLKGSEKDKPKEKAKEKPAAAVKQSKVSGASETPKLPAPTLGISTAPMMVPVPTTPPALPESVTKRLEKTFATEPAQQGIVKDVKTVKNTFEESEKAKAEALAAKAEAAKREAAKSVVVTPEPSLPPLPEKKEAAPALPPALPLPPLGVKAEPAKAVEPAKDAAKAPEKKDALPSLPPALPLPPIGVKAEPVKAAEKAIEKKEAVPPQPAVLPLPMPALPDKKLEPTPAEPVKAPPVKTVPVETLPPAELPPASVKPPSVLPAAKAEAKPIVLPKSEIASVPKIGNNPAAALALPELPKPPSAAEPAKKEVAPPATIETVKKEDSVKAPPTNLPLPALPKLPGEGTLAIPPKPALPSLTAITGEKPPSTADVLEPKDAIQAAPLAPAVAAVAPAALPLPSLPALPGAKKAEPQNAVDAATPAKEPAKEAAPAKANDTLTTSLTYTKSRVDLSEDAKSKLTAIAEGLKKSQGSVRVVAYASGTAEEASVSRRTAFARGTEIRAFFIAKGVDKLNVTVQVGTTTTDANADRAEIFVK